MAWPGPRPPHFYYLSSSWEAKESQLRASAGHGKLDRKTWLYSHLLSGLGKLLALTRLGFLIC